MKKRTLKIIDEVAQESDNTTSRWKSFQCFYNNYSLGLCECETPEDARMYTMSLVILIGGIFATALFANISTY